MKAAAALVLLLLSFPAPAAARGKITIEKATIPWDELLRLLGEGGQPAPRPPPPGAPLAYSIQSAQIGGVVESGRATLTLELSVQVLTERWVVAPLLPPSLAVASATVTAPGGQRGILVRDSRGVALAAEGAGSYRVELVAEGGLEATGAGSRLVLAPPGLAGGRARLRVEGAERIAGKTGWSVTPGPGGSQLVEAALGAAGVELVLSGVAQASGGEAGTALEQLEAETVVGLDGRGVTRLTVAATPGEGGALLLSLPEGAVPWKVWVRGRALPLAGLLRGRELRIPLAGAGTVEVAYTFAAPPIGIRGRYRVELPHLPVPVRDASWRLWLPEGFVWKDTQASLPPSGGCVGSPLHRPRTALSPQGACRSFARPVLEPGRAYVEGSYQQPL